MGDRSPGAHYQRQTIAETSENPFMGMNMELTDPESGHFLTRR
jgi:hypothetical protein